MRRRVVWVGLFVLAVLVGGLVPVAQAGNNASLSWSSYNVDIQVNRDGTLTVTEIQTIQFSGGSYHKGFRTIPQSRGRISNVAVWEGDQRYESSYSNGPYTFQTSTDDNGDLQVDWYFPYTSNSAHTYTLQYTVRDGLLYYPDKQYDRLQWIALPVDHQYPIAASTVTVHLPSGAPILIDNGHPRIGVSNQSSATASLSTDRQSATFKSTGTLAPGQSIEVRVDFQAGAVAGSPPDWQSTYDFQEQYGPLITLASLGLGVLLLIGGSLLVLLRWYTAGRDPQVGLAADYVAEPPGALPPGVVGTLVDERADVQDIIATLIDLARRGYVTMDEEQKSGFMGIGMTRDFIFKRVSQADLSQLLDYEKKVLTSVIPGDERRLSDLKNSFYTHIPGIQRGLYKEVVREGLFPVSPDTVRNRWLGGGIALIVLAVIGGIVAVNALSNISGAIVVPFIGLGFVGLVIAGVSSAMPVKTRKGAEAKATWLAFKRYLSNLEKYTKVDEAKDQFDKYLPYAIAFGVDRSWINKFARTDTPIPIWYHPFGYPYGGGVYGVPGRMSSGGGLGRMGTPSIQGMSDGLAGSLQSMSTGLSSLLNTASSTFTSHPSSSGGGGGWGGGGFSGGGGGGGGGAGFG